MPLISSLALSIGFPASSVPSYTVTLTVTMYSKLLSSWSQASISGTPPNSSAAVG